MDVHSGFLTEFGLVFGPKGQRRWQDDRTVRSVAETLEVGAHGAMLRAASQSFVEDGTLVLPATSGDAEPVQGRCLHPWLLNR
jgi:hypothetical protein